MVDRDSKQGWFVETGMSIFMGLPWIVSFSPGKVFLPRESLNFLGRQENLNQFIWTRFPAG